MRSRHTFVLVVVLGVLMPAEATAQTGMAPPATDLAASGSYLVFSPTAHAVPAGHGYFQMTQILFPRFQVGLTSRISVGAATFALAPRAVLLTPKVQVLHGESVNVAAGVMHLAGISRVHTGIAYVVATTDVGDVSINTGIGVGYAAYRDEDDTQVRGRETVGMIGAELRDTSASSTLLEAYLFGGQVAQLTIARRRSVRRFSIDYGLLVMPSSSSSHLAPIVNFGWRF